MVRAAALTLLLLTAAAPPRTFAERVASYKHSLLESADQAFVEAWPEFQPKLAPLGVGADSVRAATRWSTLGFSLGVCGTQATPTLLADWYSRFDRLDFGTSEVAGDIRDKISEMGQAALAEGKADHSLDQITDKERRLYCRAELEATRQILSEP